MKQKQELKICLATAEFAPLAKTGGLADVSAALAAYLHRAGHDVRVLMPRYASLKDNGLKITPVDFLQDIPISIGPRSGHYSIDEAVLPDSGLTIYLLRCPDLYDRDGIYSDGDDEHRRFILLSRASIEMCQRMRFAPDIFHVHDWHTALVPLYLKTVYAWDKLFAQTRSVLTIHNIGYQGVFPANILEDLDLGSGREQLHQEDLAAGKINFLKTAVLYADLVTTVSPTYAREIQGDEYGMGLQSLLRARKETLVGILNGVDYAEWDPRSDPLIPANYSSSDLTGKAECKRQLLQKLGLKGREGKPLVGIVTRLVGQKGVDLMEAVLPRLLSGYDFSLAVLGSGETRYEKFFTHLQQLFPGRVCFYRGYNNELAHMIEAGSDMFLMPSAYEPCGLNQMYSLRYGTVPIVRETGGLADSVQQFDPDDGSGTGIVFRDYDATGLRWALQTALELFENEAAWQAMIQNGMSKDYSWDRQGEVYVDLFHKLSGSK